ncbi:MAG: biliverdin-producing heme oxygenase [Thermoanaerobaculia bacterium]
MSDVMERLKDGTWDLHQAAEGHDFQQRMVGGGLTREEYAAWLGQMLLVHRALEEPLARLAETDGRFAAVRPEQMQVPYLEADLEALGVDPGSVRPLPATSALVSEIERDAAQEPLRLLGHHYVLEGSNNGNRFIARRLLPALGLQDGSAGRYLDPYGDRQRELWAGFKAAMGEVPLSASEIDLLVDAARRMFAGIGALSGDLEAVSAA